jgi:hypothetical protein
LRRWLARVWPAIALGRNGAALLAKLEDKPWLTLADVAQLLVLGAIGTSGDLVSASADPASSPSGHATAPADPPTAPNNSLAPRGREITFFVIFSFAALLALLVSTLWVEIRSKYLYR